MNPGSEQTRAKGLKIYGDSLDENVIGETRNGHPKDMYPK